MWKVRLITLFKAGGVPVAVSATTTALMVVLIFTADALASDPGGSVFSIVSAALEFGGWGALAASTVGGWLFLRRQLQSRVALLLLLPYLAIVGIGLGVVTVVTMAITGEGP